MEIVWIHFWVNSLVLLAHLKHLAAYIELTEIVPVRLNEKENGGIKSILHLVLSVDSRSNQVDSVPSALLYSGVFVVLVCGKDKSELDLLHYWKRLV